MRPVEGPGTPRSGTIVTQRLCCELPGVVMPPETHFLHLFASRAPGGGGP